MKYISILRGINVGGHKKIKMADLKALYESFGFSNVITYIQSGNVIFEFDNEDKSALISTIERGIKQMYNFHVAIDLRSSSEFAHIKSPNKHLNHDIISVWKKEMQEH